MIARLLRAFATCGCALIVPHSGGAQENWPQRPLKMEVISAAGGLTDIVARVVAKHLGSALGQPVVVENRPGAGGNVAAGAVAKADPDGLTLLITGSNQAVNPTLLPNPGFDYDRDFAPVAMAAVANMLLVASNSLPANNITDVIKLAKAKPGSISMAISPIGTPNHLGAELLSQLGGIDLTFVPYGGIGPATPDLIAGRVQLAIAAMPSLLPQVRAGSVKALAVTRPERASVAPDIPSAKEAGLPSLDIDAWICILTTGGTPAPVVARLSAEIAKIMTLPEVKVTFAKQGVETWTMAPEELGAFLKSEAKKYADILKNAKARR